MRTRIDLLLVLLPLLSQGLSQQDLVQRPICDVRLRNKYCDAWYGGDLHTGKTILSRSTEKAVPSPLITIS